MLEKETVMKMNLSNEGERNLLNALAKAGMNFQQAAAIIDDPSLAKEFVEAGVSAIKGKHRLLK